MTTYYSQSTNSFYIVGIHTEAPDDVVEITEQEHRDILTELEKDKVLTSDSNGRPIVKDKEQADVNDIKVRALAAIDKVAGRARSKFTPDNDFIHFEYALSYAAAVEYITSGVASPFVASHAEAYEVSLMDAARTIKATGDAFNFKLALIRDLRLKAKIQVSKVTTNDEVISIAHKCMNALQEL